MLVKSYILRQCLNLYSMPTNPPNRQFDFSTLTDCSVNHNSS